MADQKLIHLDPAGELQDADVLYVVQDTGEDNPLDRKVSIGVLRTELVRDVNEVPVGVIDGNNKDFTLSSVPYIASLRVFMNGLLQESGVGNDFTFVGQTISFSLAPLPGDKIRTLYRKV